MLLAMTRCISSATPMMPDVASKARRPRPNIRGMKTVWITHKVNPSKPRA